MANIKTTKPSHFAVKQCDLKASIQDVDLASRMVTGFYNTYNFLDYDGDVLLPGCAKRSIKNNGPKSSAVAKIKHALNHDLTELPGKILVLDERTINIKGVGPVDGIYFETLMADTECGNDTLKNYQAEIYDNHSIGFRYIMDKLTMIERESKAAWDRVVGQLINPEAADERVYLWTVGEIKLFEGSTVAFGANSLTPFLGMGKSMSKESVMFDIQTRIGKLENALKCGTQTDDTMMSFEIQTLQLKQMIEDISEFVVIDADAETTLMRKQKEREAELKAQGKKTISALTLDVSKFSL
jgi:phage head maturation protease